RHRLAHRSADRRAGDGRRPLFELSQAAIEAAREQHGAGLGSIARVAVSSFGLRSLFSAVGHGYRGDRDLFLRGRTPYVARAVRIAPARSALLMRRSI